MFHSYVVAGFDSLPGRFHFLRVEHERRSVPNHAHDKAVRRLRESLRQIAQRPDFFPVDLIDDAGAVRGEISIRRIGQNVCQDYDFGMFEVDLLDDQVIKIMPDAEIARLICVDQVEGERLEQKAAVKHIARPHIIGVREIKIRPDRTELDLDRERFLVAQDFELHDIAFEFSFDHFGHFDAVTFQFHRPVARDGMIVDRQEHVAGLQTFRSRSRRDDSTDEDSEIDILVVVTILDVCQETVNHRRRNHISDALRNVAAVALECDANHFRILHHRTAAVTRIDLRADLNREMGINRRMGVELEIDARNDTGRDRHAFAAERITVSRDGRFQLGNSAEGEGNHVLEEILVRHIDQRQVAIVRHEQDRGGIFIRIAVTLDREIARIADDVRIRHDAVAFDDKTCPDAALDSARIPRRPIIGFDFRRRDADETLLDFPIRTQRHGRRRDDVWQGSHGRTGGRLRFPRLSRWTLLLCAYFSAQHKQNRQQNCATPHRKSRR